MEGVIILGTIIVVIVAIAQICLFFKLWEMCNNVIKIRDGSESDKITPYRICYMKGDMKRCKEKLDESLYSAILENYYSGDIEYNIGFQRIVKLYDRRYLKVGLIMPDVEKYRNQLDFPL
jgi:hypothetical protein